jgi:hypothetical protein
MTVFMLLVVTRINYCENMLQYHNLVMRK